MYFQKVGERQQRGKLVKQTCTVSLLLPSLRSYGLTPTAVMAITEEGTPITVPLLDAPGPSVPGPSPQSATPPAQDVRTLYLLDTSRYGVSDEFFHELAQVMTTLCVLVQYKYIYSTYKLYTCVHMYTYVCALYMLPHFTKHCVGDTRTPSSFTTSKPSGRI